MKYKIGDYVEVVKSHGSDVAVEYPAPPIGTRGKIVSIEEDWIYPYEVDFDEESLYGDDMLKLVEEELGDVDDTVEDVEYEEKVEEFHLVYKREEQKFLLFDGDKKLLLDMITLTDPRDNPYLHGFFDGYNLLGRKFVVSIEIIG